MIPIAIDADALHCIKSFGLLAEAERHVAQAPDSPPLLLCTQFVAHHELNPLAKEISAWQASGLLRIEDVPSRSPTSKMRRVLAQKHRGMDKGEAEVIAWILIDSPTTPFVSCDVRARSIARAERVQAWDVLDLVHEWLARGVVSLVAAQSCLMPWIDDPKARWRPKGFVGVEPTLRSRYGSRYLQPLELRSKPEPVPSR